jgi:hypothetical protein
MVAQCLCGGNQKQQEKAPVVPLIVHNSFLLSRTPVKDLDRVGEFTDITRPTRQNLRDRLVLIQRKYSFCLVFSHLPI